MSLITKMPPHVYMQQVRRNRGRYCDVKTLKCTSVCNGEYKHLIQENYFHLKRFKLNNYFKYNNKL